MLDAASELPHGAARRAGEGLGLAAVATFAALAVAASEDLWPSVDSSAWLWTLVAGAAAAALVGRLSVRAHGHDALFLGATLILFAVSRVSWAAWTPTRPVSDFALYDWLGTRIAAGGPIPLHWPEMGVIAAWGYGVLLGGAYAAFGPGLRVALGVNVVLGALAVLAEYAFVRRVAGAAAARAAAALLVVWPGHLLYGGVLGSEHLAIPLLLAGLLGVARALDDAPARLASAPLVAGAVLLAAAFLTRSVLGTAVAASVVCLLLDGRRPASRRLVRCAVLVVVFLACVGLWRVVLQKTLGARPHSATWWSVMVGANAGAAGGWNEDDARRYTAHPDVDAANADARAEAWRRIAADPLAYARLAAAKIALLWRDGTHPVYWTRLAMTEGPAAVRLRALEPTLVAVAQAFHLLTLVLAVAGMVLVLSTGPPRGGLALAWLVLLLTTAVHGVVESQPRYNFALQPLLLAFAAIAVTRTDRRATGRVKRP